MKSLIKEAPVADEITDADKDLLSELGVDTDGPAEHGARPPREQRIIAGFEEIERFVAEHGRPPEHGEARDIFERLYAVRLERLRASTECRTVLAEFDTRGLLGPAPAPGETASDMLAEEPSAEELLRQLGVTGEPEPADELTQLTHVRTREEIRAAEEVAKRNPCADFARFKPRFAAMQADLASGARQTIKFQDNAATEAGDMFILEGQKVLVAELGEPFVSNYDRPDRRLRVVYDNGTESDLLLRSLQRALNKDKTSRRITQTNLGPLFSDVEEPEDLPSGFIYVLRSKSDDPFVAQNRAVIHKIGVTGGDVKSRVVNAKKDPTYLLAEVDVVATFKLANINRKKLELLLHKFFFEARLDVALKDRFGQKVEPREWFLVPLPVIEETIAKIQAGTLERYRYNAQAAMIVEAV